MCAASDQLLIQPLYEYLDTQATRWQIICRVSMIDDILGKIHQG